MKSLVKFALVLLSLAATQAEVRVHHIFGPNMVLQRDKPIRVWGYAGVDEPVSVEFAGQRRSTTGGDEGRWVVKLSSLSASSEPRTFTVKGRTNTVVFEQVLVGDVWILGGQSNMEFPLDRVYGGDLEAVSANFPNIRLMSIPIQASAQPRHDFESSMAGEEKKGDWLICSPETVKAFSAIGYIFGRRLHQALQVPIGLIDNSRGGTTVEAWTSRAMLSTLPEAEPLLKFWDEKIAAYSPQEDLRQRVAAWEKKMAAPRKPGQSVGPKPTQPNPSPAENPNNPGASYNGMLAVFGGLTVKGALFHQGYNNALADARPALYARTLNAMIRDWRQTFLDEQMPFGIVELSAGGQPQTLENYEAMMVDPGPFIREGQLQAARDLPNIGFACAYDQQVAWYHPFKKIELGERIARWALATQHGFKLPWEPALCTGVETNGNHLVLTFNQGLATHDDRPLEGFAVAGPDRHFYPAKAEFFLIGKDDRGRNRYDQKKIQVASDLVPEPVAVRYAWARNPLGNLVSGGHGPKYILPAPAFRTDRWDWPDVPFVAAGAAEASRLNRQKRQQATEWARQRQRAEAESILKTEKKPNPE